MKVLKSTLLVLFALFAASAAQADQLDRIKQRGKIVIGIKDDYPPFGFLEADGSINGYEILIAKAIAKKLLGSESAADMVTVVAANRMQLLNSGRIDLIVATLGVTEERAKAVDFTVPYYNLRGGIVVAAKGSPVKAWEDLKGRTICGLQGSIAVKTYEGYGAKTVLFTGTPELFAAFQDNRCELLGYDELPTRYRMNTTDWKDKYEVVLQGENSVLIAGGVRKNEPRFLAAVNDAIESIAAEGVMLQAETTFQMQKSPFVAQQHAEMKAKKK